MRTCPKCGARYADAMAYCPNDGTATTLVAEAGRTADPFVGATIDGRYRIEGRIGEGGMGVVYRAAHTVLRKPLAIKVMRGEQANDPEIVQRFVQEAQASSAIGHPNIIAISDFGTTTDGSVYFAMELLEGQSLAKAMERGPLPHERALHIFIQMASALDAAHQRGIVHRDLKPDNVFLIKQGADADFVKVLDFGIAKVKNAAAKITRTGMVFGTPHYMSPEQAAGQAVDHRSDIYSFGVMMYQVFAGQLPFEAESYMGVITKHMYDSPVPPSRVLARVPASIEAIILKTLEKKPELRYQSMIELKDDLERVRKGEAPRGAERKSLVTADTLSPMPPPRASVAATPTLSEIGADTTAAIPGRRRARWPLVALALCALGVALALLLARSDGPKPAAVVRPERVAAPTPAPAPTVAVPPAPMPAPEPPAVAPVSEPPAVAPARAASAAAAKPSARKPRPPAQRPAAPASARTTPRRPSSLTDVVDPWQ